MVEILATDDRFYPSFKRHSLYLRMLEDLGILPMNDEELEYNNKSIELENDDTKIDLDLELNSKIYFDSTFYKESNSSYNKRNTKNKSCLSFMLKHDLSINTNDFAILDKKNTVKPVVSESFKF